MMKPGRFDTWRVDTQNWWPGKKVLVSPQWIEQVSWPDSKVYVHLRGNRQHPEYIESMTVTREYENRLYDYYDRSPYWLQKSEQPSCRTASKG